MGKQLPDEKILTIFRHCPCFDQDRVNFLQNLGENMARTLTYSVPPQVIAGWKGKRHFLTA